MSHTTQLNVDDVLDFLGDGSGYMISELDAKSGFRQLEVDKETKPLLAYITRNRHFEYNYMPMGVAMATQAFQI